MPKRPLPAGIKPDRPVEIANRLNSAAIHLLRRISRDDGADGVTGARLSALSVLVYGGPQTVGALARREGVATPTMTRIVDALVRDGIVTRTSVEGDRRQVRLTATEDGRRLMERALAATWSRTRISVRTTDGRRSCARIKQRSKTKVIAFNTRIRANNRNQAT